MEQNNELNTMDIQAVMEHLPHRYPFLLVDRVVDYKVGEYLKGYKNITFNEPYFQGHFPQKPVMPGVLIMEALAQATGLLAFKTTETKPSEGSLYYLVGIDNARFKQKVGPGDRLDLEVTVKKVRRGVWSFDAVASVDGQIVASADLMCAEREA